MMAMVSMMAKGCIVPSLLPLISYFLFCPPNYINIYAIIVQMFSYLDKRQILQQIYSKPPILPSLNFRWVVKYRYYKKEILIHPH